MLRRLVLGVAIAVWLGGACAAPASESSFGTFNFRTGLFRKLWKPWADKPQETKYPIVLAHGICGFERIKWGPIEVRYFAGIQKHLRSLGFEVLTTIVPPTGSIQKRAEALAAQIRKWKPEGKVNIIAHSMGGLDSRYMISKLGMGDRIATVTMVGTPNHGTLIADWAVYYGSERFSAVEKFCKLVGIDTRGFHDLSVRYMMGTFNPNVPDDPRVSYRSVAGSQKTLISYLLPLMATHTILKGLEKKAVHHRLDKDDAEALARIDRVHGLGYALSEKGMADVIRTLPTEWIQPALAGKTDGLVSMSSVRKGKYLGDIDADHLDQMGWLTSFDAKGFYQAIAEGLAQEGY